MKFDEILKNIGEFGLYQRILYVLLCFPLVAVGMHNVNSALLLFIPNHRCRIPGYVNDTYEIQGSEHERLINLTIPVADDESYMYSQCEMYVRSASDQYDVTLENKTRVSCSSWVYDKSVFTSTFVSEQNVVCTKNKLEVANMQTISYVGDTVGAFTIGVVSDTIGRKKTLCMSMLFLLLSTIGLSWAPNETVFIAIKFLSGIGSTGVYLSSFVLGMELVGPSKRTWAGTLISYYYALGIMLLAVIGYWFRDWFWIEILNAVPVVLFLVFWRFVPESPRWLISKGREREAAVIVKKVAMLNKTDSFLPPEKEFEDNDEETPKETDTIWNLFSSCVMLRRSFVIFFNWFAVSLGYFGLSLSVDRLKGDFYLIVFLTGLVELPAYTLCVLCLDRVGRKKFYVSAMMLAGVALTSTAFPALYHSEVDLQLVTVALVLIGNFGVAAAYATIFLWSAEVFPTAVRNSGIGVSSTFSCLGLIFCPYIADLNQVIGGRIGQASPFVVFGLAAVIGGLMSVILPETRNADLPETMKQAEHLDYEGYALLP